MQQRETFSEKIRRRYREQAAREDEAVLERSKAYHRYFENWLEYEVTTPKGKKRILRVYDGAWYTQKMTTPQRRWLKAGYALLWLLAAGLFAWGAFQWTDSNGAKYVLLTQGLGLVGLVISAYALVMYLIAPVRMTVGEYQSSAVTLQRFSRISGVAVASSCVSTLLYVILHPGAEDVGRELLCALAFLLAGGAVFLLGWIEKEKVEYDIQAARPTVPEGAEKIRDRDLAL